MNKILLVAAIIGIVALLAFGTISFVKANTTAKSTQQITSCSSCQGKCTAENNCGLSTCGAVNGGACGCSKAR